MDKVSLINWKSIFYSFKFLTCPFFDCLFIVLRAFLTIKNLNIPLFIAWEGEKI